MVLFSWPALDTGRSAVVLLHVGSSSLHIVDLLGELTAVSLEVNRGWTVGLVAAVGLEDGTSPGPRIRLSGIPYKI